jgi:hypothetical protein
MMKNKLNASLLAALFAIMTSAACTRKLAVESASKTDFGGVVQANKAAGDPVYLNDIDINVLRSFYKTYGEIPGTKWFKSANGFGVTFKDNGMNKTIYYKLNGLVDTEILYYFEGQLPRQVRHLVKSHFYDYTITHVTEVHKNGATAFYVKVEDNSTIKTLKIVEEEWEVAETLVKR